LDNPSAALHVASASGAPELQITQDNSSDYTRLRMNVSGYPSWEMDVSPGPTPQLQFWNGSEQMYIDFSGNVTATSFNPTSDRNAKEHFAPVDVREVLDKVASLPITRWNFKQDGASPHMGPMAQDFHAAFGLGPDDKRIPTVDADGVALAAIQGLNRKVDEHLKAKDEEIVQLKQSIARLEDLVSKLTAQQQSELK